MPVKFYLPAIILTCLIAITFPLFAGCVSIATTKNPPAVTSSATQTTKPTAAAPTTISYAGIAGISVVIEPCLDDPEGDISFNNVMVEKSKYYGSFYDPILKKQVQQDTCFLISGNITNKSGKRYWVAYHAVGINKSGNFASGTMDTGPIVGVAQLCFEQTKIESFVLHQSWSENISVFRIYSQKSAIMFP
jgi:hypothetical protein